jgi:hypothetical protein
MNLFMKTFPNQIYAAIYEGGKTKPVKHFQCFDALRFKQLNEEGFAIYVTSNSFDGVRKKGSLKKLNAIVGDLDIAKDTDDLSPEEKEERKQRVLSDLQKYCPPSCVVITKNGIQPWYFLDEDKIDSETLQLYEGVMCGLIDLSMEIGCMGDETKDVARLWRLPGYLHQKSDPFEITEVAGNGHLWELRDLKEFFWRDAVEETTNPHAATQSDNPLWQEMNKIDIREIVIRAGKQSGREIKFGKDGHMILNGERRGTFIGTGGDFIATQSSVDPIKGNRVTVVADMLNITNREAVQWICHQFDKDPRWEMYG